MTSITIDFPESTLSALHQAPQQLAAEVRLAAAIHWYQQSRMSLERAAESAGCTRTAFLAELARCRIDVSALDPEDLRAELQASDRSVELAWRSGHADALQRYAGEWVILEGEEIVGHGADLKALVDAARSHGIRSPYAFFVDESGEGTIGL